MFESNQQDFGGESYGQGGGSGALALARSSQAVPIGKRVRGDWMGRLAAVDPVVDLGARIGSREWFRGLVTCLGLCAAAVMLAPSFGPMPTVGEAPMATAQADEARALAIWPLAYGADTGRRLAATDAVEPLADTPERPRIELAATIGQGDGFARVLERAGVSRDESAKITALVRDEVPLGDLRAGTRMDLVLGRRDRRTDPRPIESLAFRATFDLKLAIERVDDALRLKRIPIAVDDTPLRIQGRVGSNLVRSARAAGVPDDAVQAFVRAIAQKLPLGQIGSDARFDAILAHRRAEPARSRMAA